MGGLGAGLGPLLIAAGHPRWTVVPVAQWSEAKRDLLWGDHRCRPLPGAPRGRLLALHRLPIPEAQPEHSTSFWGSLRLK